MKFGIKKKTKKFNNWAEAFFKAHKKGIKISYLLFIIIAIIYAFISIKSQISIKSITNAFSKLTLWKILLVILLGSISVIPMVVYDYTYVKKTKSNISLLELIKNSFIVNSFTNACGGGGIVGTTLRPKLFGKPSKQLIETAKVLAQIALFTMVGLITNDILAMILNFNHLLNLPVIMKIGCFGCIFYSIVPYIMNNSILNKHDHIVLIIGSSIEWLFALGFFIVVGLLMGIHFNIAQSYLAVCFAGIIGAASLIPGGFGSFDSAIILGLHLLGIPTSEVVAWAFVYRACYYWIPFIISVLLLSGSTLINKISK